MTDRYDVMIVVSIRSFRPRCRRRFDADDFAAHAIARTAVELPHHDPSNAA
jgi:hypothetical protein